MRLSYLFIIVSAILNGCQVYNISEPEARINNIPTPPNSANVDLYFQGETPKEDYVKIKVLEVRTGIEGDYNKMLESLKSKAKSEGMDGIIILGKTEEKYIVPSSYSSTFNSVRSYESGYSLLSGVGIKYSKNLGYLRVMPKSITIYKLNASDSLDPQAQIDLYFTGDEKSVRSIKNRGNEYYEEYYRRFSPQFLLEQKAGWRYLENESSLLRYYYNGEFLLAKCKIPRPFHKELIKSFEVLYTDINGSRKKFNYIFEKDTKGKISNASIYTTKENDLIETRDYLYNNDGTVLLGYLIKRNFNGKETVTKALFDFYTDADIAALK